MKLLTLPVCPRCGKKYSYREAKMLKSSRKECIYCGKKISVGKMPQGFILMAFVCAVMIIFDLIVFVTASSLDLTGFIIMTAIDAAAVTAGVLMLPLTVRLKAEKLTKSEKKRSKGAVKNGGTSKNGK